MELDPPRNFEIVGIEGVVRKGKLDLQFCIRSISLKKGIWRVKVEIRLDGNLIEVFYPIVSAKKDRNLWFFRSNLGLYNISGGRHSLGVTVTGLGVLSGFAGCKQIPFEYDPMIPLQKIEERNVETKRKTGENSTLVTIPDETRRFYDDMRRRVKKELTEEREG